MSEWQPAETAPKGVPIIAYGSVTHWQFKEEQPKEVLHAICEDDGYWWNPTGDCYTDGGYEIINVTHWHPLPKPPENA